jgi:hypothetical protein
MSLKFCISCRRNGSEFNFQRPTCIRMYQAYFHSPLRNYVHYSFTSRSRIFHLYGDVTIAGEGLQSLGLCSAIRAFEQEVIFIVPHLLWHGASVFPVSSEGPPHSVAFYDTQGDVEDLFLPGSSQDEYSRTWQQIPLYFGMSQDL